MFNNFRQNPSRVKVKSVKGWRKATNQYRQQRQSNTNGETPWYRQFERPHKKGRH